MSTIGQIQAHNTIMGTQYARIGSQIGRRARIRLYVDAPIVCIQIKQRQSTALSQAFNLVNELIATIVTAAENTTINAIKSTLKLKVH